MNRELEFTTLMMTLHHYINSIEDIDVRIEFLRDFITELKQDMLMVEANKGLE